MDTALVAAVAAEASQTTITSVYQNNRIKYEIESCFTNKVKLADALYYIALTKIKSA